MTVYVDDVAHPFQGMIMCHMWADTEAELFAMADKIGVARKWIQGHPTSIGKGKHASWVHFDIARSKRALALNSGAVLTDLFGPAEWQANRDLQSNDPKRVEHAVQTLSNIANSRELRKRKEYA